MAGQTGQNVYVALKAEPVAIGVPDVTVTGAAKFLLNAGPALRLAQALIRPGGIFSDGQRRAPRGGSHSVSGSLVGDLTYGDHDIILAASVRGTYSTNVLTPGVPLVRSSYTIETREADVDVSTLSKGCRIGGFTQNGAPDSPITMEYPVVGITQSQLTGASSPFYTTPTEPDDDYMTATDAVIQIDGVTQATLTAWSVTVENGAQTVPIVGTKFSPDVYDGNLGLTGSITLIRDTANLALQASYIANTTIDLKVTAENLGGDAYEFLYQNLFLTDFTMPLGDDGPMIVTIPFEGGKSGADPIVQVTRTPAA